MRIARNIFLAVLALLLLPYLLTPFYAAGHPVSTLMLGRWLSGAPVSRQWLDLDEIAPALPRSVVGAEDAKFCTHHGIDWDSVREVIDDLQDGEAARGGSTITQQVAKNLFLWPGRSVLRKALEAPLALWIDLVLSKQRVLEIYLNIAEWGPDGQFGAEAGAQYAFGESPAGSRRGRRRCWRRSCPIRGPAAPAIPGPGCGGWPRPMWRGRNRPNWAAAGAAGAADPVFGAEFCGVSTLALRRRIRYKPGLIRICPRLSRRRAHPVWMQKTLQGP